MEHPFGTMKAAMGCEGSWTRGLENVRSEMRQTLRAYDLKRVLNIIGTRGLLEVMG